MMRVARFVLSAVVVGLAVTFGCLTPTNYDDSMTRQGATATSTTSTGSTGGGTPCSPTDDSNPCTDQTCVMGVPIYTPSPMGASCMLTKNANAKVCDGNGECVECLANTQCMTGLKATCDIANHKCVSCSDGEKNNGETGIDCGGPCPRCDGDTCGTSGDCQSNVCADGVCCDKDCSATCNSCNVPGKAGTCTTVTRGLEDDGCTVGYACNGVGACADPMSKNKAGEFCSKDSECYTGACNGMCRLPVFAPCAEDAECASLRCIAHACMGCSLGSECASKNCSTNTGRCMIPDGGVCSGDNDCSGDECSSIKLCGQANGDACANGSDCSTHYCNAAGKCDYCSVTTQADDCASHLCNATGSCLLLLNAPCTADWQCATSKCSTSFPRKCQ